MRSDRIRSKYKISYTIQYKRCERYRGHRKADSGAEQRIRDFFKKDSENHMVYKRKVRVKKRFYLFINEPTGKQPLQCKSMK